MTDRVGDWAQTYTGKHFYALDPRPEDVCIEDIAHALSLVCRFGGHCREFYSVAEYSVRVSQQVERRRISRDGPGIRGGLVLAALLHDAAEAYVGDMVRPLKRSMPDFAKTELRVLAAIDARFAIGADDRVDTVIKLVDDILLATEARDLMDGASAAKWNLRAEPLVERVRPMTPMEAERAFMERFVELGGRLC